MILVNIHVLVFFAFFNEYFQTKRIKILNLIFSKYICICRHRDSTLEDKFNFYLLKKKTKISNTFGNYKILKRLKI